MKLPPIVEAEAKSIFSASVKKTLAIIQAECDKRQKEWGECTSVDVLEGKVRGARIHADATQTDEALEDLMVWKRRLQDARDPEFANERQRHHRARNEKHSRDVVVPAVVPLLKKVAAAVKKIADAQLAVEESFAKSIGLPWQPAIDASNAVRALQAEVARREAGIAELIKDKERIATPAGLLKAAGLDAYLADAPAAKG